jgi:hypothetical protein
MIAQILIILCNHKVTFKMAAEKLAYKWIINYDLQLGKDAG